MVLILIHLFPTVNSELRASYKQWSMNPTEPQSCCVSASGDIWIQATLFPDLFSELHTDSLRAQATNFYCLLFFLTLLSRTSVKRSHITSLFTSNTSHTGIFFTTCICLLAWLVWRCSLRITMKICMCGILKINFLQNSDEWPCFYFFSRAIASSVSCWFSLHWTRFY